MDTKGDAERVLAGVEIMIVVALAFSVYTVDQIEQAVVTRFGRPVRVILNTIEGKRKEKMLVMLKQRYSNENISVAAAERLSAADSERQPRPVNEHSRFFVDSPQQGGI